MSLATFLLLCVLCVLTNSTIIYSEPFIDNTFTSRFVEQYSYNDHTPAGLLEHFKIVTFGGKKVLNITLLSTDQTFELGSTTDPRSEISEQLFSILPNVEYQVSWNWYLETYQAGYYFCFMQLFQDTVPNVMLRWEDDQYLLYKDGANSYVVLAGNINNDIGKWITWQVNFRLSTTNGYIYVYKDTVLVGSFIGVTLSAESDSYFKQGIYTQHVNPADTSTLISNLVFSTSTGSGLSADIADSATQTNDQPALSQGAIIGISVGCVVTVLLVVIVVVFRLQKRNMMEVV